MRKLLSQYIQHNQQRIVVYIRYHQILMSQLSFFPLCLQAKTLQSLFIYVRFTALIFDLLFINDSKSNIIISNSLIKDSLFEMNHLGFQFFFSSRNRLQKIRKRNEEDVRTRQNHNEYLIVSLINQIEDLLRVYFEYLPSNSPSIYNQMLLQNIKKIIHQADLFSSNQLLRYNSDTQYNTITGGLLSIAIIVVIVLGFASMIADTLNRSSITSTTTTLKHSDPPLSIVIPGQEHMFMFAVAIQSYDQAFFANLSSTTTQYFDIQMYLYKYVNGWSTLYPIDLQPCTQEHWSMLPDFVDRFNTYNVSSWLCLPLHHEFTLQGAFTSPLNDAVSIEVHPCRNKTSKEICAPQEEIDQLFEDYGNFYLTFNYVNPVINPNSVNFLDYYLQGDDYGIFSNKIGSQTWISFSDYSIITDNSIWPYSDYLYQNGCIVQQKATNHPYSISGDIIYASVYLAKSGNSLIINRQVQKISAVFSYIGGLVGAVTALLFLIKSYTDSSLEVSIGLNLFQQKESPDQVGEEIHTFDFSSYMSLVMYRFLRFFGWDGKWPFSQRLDNYQKESLKQLDVQILLKRLIKIETCMAHLLTPEQLKRIKNEELITIETAQKMRQQLLKSQQKEQEAGAEKQIALQHMQKNDMYFLRMVDAIQNTETGMSLNRRQQIILIEEIKSGQTKKCIRDRAKQEKGQKKEMNIFLEPKKSQKAKEIFGLEIPQDRIDQSQ